MTIFKSAYDTTIGSIDDNVRTVVKEFIHSLTLKDKPDSYSNLGVNVVGEYTPYFVTGALPSEHSIPLFPHPVLVDNTISKRKYIISDIRLFVDNRNIDSDNVARYNPNVRNKTEYNLIKSRLVLSALWVNQNPSIIRSNLIFASTMFGAWLSECISKAYALDFKDQTTLNIIGCYYYNTLFTEKSMLDEEQETKLATQVMKSTRSSASIVFDVFAQIGSVDNIDMLCKKISTILTSSRLTDFNVPMLLNTVKNSWYGANAKDLITVGLEHPPTWCAIIYAALSDKTFKSSNIYKIAERFGKGGAADEYMNNYKSLIADHTETVDVERMNLIDMYNKEQFNSSFKELAVKHGLLN